MTMDKASPPLPQTLEMERAVLGACLLNREAIEAVVTTLTPGDFYDYRNELVWSAMVECWTNNSKTAAANGSPRVPTDLRLVAEQLRKRDHLESIGGVSYLLALTESCPTSYHVTFYAEEVLKASIRRKLIGHAQDMATSAYDEAQSLERLRAALQGKFDAIFDQEQQGDGADLCDLVDRRWEFFADSDKHKRPGLMTGYRDLDEVTKGLQKSDFLIIGARPSVGKTSFALGLAYGITSEDPEACGAIFSLEMNQDQLLDRLTAMECGVPTDRLRAGDLTTDEAERVAGAFSKLRERHIHVDDNGFTSVDKMRMKLLQLRRRWGRLDFVIIDYIQLMISGKGKENRVQEVSDISRSLKQLARELNIPIIGLSQLSRALEARQIKVPMLSDLRESGSLEQDADIVIFLYREELYDPETDRKGIAEIVIAKHRNGPVGTVELRFDTATTRFSDLTYRTPEGY